MKILVMGLPGSGKTPLAEALSYQLKCVMFNADDIRKNINKDLGFTEKDRIEQAYRMNHLCSIASKCGKLVIADFICPLPQCRLAFNADYIIWVDTIKESRYEDTNKMFVPPKKFNIRITDFSTSVQYQSKQIADAIRSHFNLSN